MTDALDRVLSAGLAEGAYTAACCLVGRGEKVLYRKAFGHLALEDSPPCGPQTLFDLASLTKPLVVGMLTLQAMEEGRLCLMDELSTFLDVERDKQHITIRQLLTHTAGYAPGLHLYERCRDPRDAARAILEAPLTYPPGEQVCYCCAGYILLGQLLECIYQADLSDLAQQKVFGPLHMENTAYNPVSGNIAATEMQDDGRCLQGVVHDENARFLSGIGGNAGVFSTMDDLALWLQMLANEGRMPNGRPFLSPAAVRAALRRQTPDGAQARTLAFLLPAVSGGFTGDLFPPETVGHTGFTGTSIALDPASGVYVVLLTNRVCPSRESLGIHRLRRLAHNAAYALAAG